MADYLDDEAPEAYGNQPSPADNDTSWLDDYPTAHPSAPPPAQQSAPDTSWLNEYPTAQPAQPAQAGEHDWLKDYPSASTTPAAEPSSLPAFVAKRAARSAAPTAAGIAAFGPGAAAGGELGLAAGAPLAPFTFGLSEPVLGGLGALVGGAITSTIGAGAVDTAQNWVLKKLGLIDDRQDAADEAAHPVAGVLADLAPSVVAFRPGSASAIARAAGAAMQGGMEAGREYANEGTFDPARIAAAAAAGSILTNPTTAGERLANSIVKPNMNRYFPGLPKEAPIEQQAQAEATTTGSEPVKSNTLGIAMQAAPPVEDVATAGNPDSAPVRDSGNDGRWAKATAEKAAPTPANPLGLSDTAVAALRGQLNPAPAAGEAPRTGFVDTGLVLGQEQSAPQPVPQAAPVPAREQQVSPAPAIEQTGPVPRERALVAQQDQQATAQPNRFPPEIIGPHPPLPDAAQPWLQRLHAGIMSNKLGDVVESAAQIALHRPIAEYPMPSGANSTVDLRGPVVVDPTVPDALRKPVAVHETVEQVLQALGHSYPDAHRIATAAEMRVVAEMGINPKQYNDTWDGLLENIEKQQVPVPPGLHVNPYEAIGHYRPEATDETGVPAEPTQDVTAPVTPAAEATAPAGEAEVQPSNEELQAQLADLRRQAAEVGLHVPTDEEKAQARAVDLARPRGQRNKNALGMTVGAGAEKAKVQSDAINAAMAAFNDPRFQSVEGEQGGQIRARMNEAIKYATEQNGGVNPLDAYKPRKSPPALAWLRSGRQLLRGKLSQANFISDELLHRGGGTEDVNATRNVEGNIARNPRMGDEAVAAAEAQQAQKLTPEDLPNVEQEEDVPKRNVAAAEQISKIIPADYDPTTATPEQNKQFASDLNRVINNLVTQGSVAPEEAALWNNNMELLKSQRVQDLLQPPKPHVVETPVPEGQTQAEREAAAGVRRIVPDSDLAQKYVTMINKAADASPARENTLVSMLRQSGSDFRGDERAALNYRRIVNDFKTASAPIRNFTKNIFGTASGDVARIGDSLLARMMAGNASDAAGYAKKLDDMWNWWKDNLKTRDVMGYLRAAETVPANDRMAFMQEMANRGVDMTKADDIYSFHPVVRELLNGIDKLEKQFGSQADYVENYMPHAFKDQKGVADWLTRYVTTLGPNWFTKVRMFDLYDQAIAAGFKLRYENPADLITHRLMAGSRSVGIMQMLQDGYKSGAFVPEKVASADPTTYGNWKKYAAPFEFEDGKLWRVSPEVEHIFNNALIQSGLWMNDGYLGSAFRGWMRGKAVWVPVKLALSAYHPIHIVGVNLANNLAREMNSTFGLKSLGKAVGQSLADPLMAAKLDNLPFIGAKSAAYDGKSARMTMSKLWDDINDPNEQVTKMLLQETGTSLNQAYQERINSVNVFKTAWAKSQYLRALPLGMAAGFEKYLQAPIFNYWIPNMKAAQLMRGVSAILQKDPGLIADPVARRVALRQLGKSVDDRFGEMFYNSLFWNKTVKDLSMASMLSLGWNLGQARQATGAVTTPLRRMLGSGSALDKVAYKHDDKGSYVFSYLATSMLAAGVISYASTGQIPSGLDYFFPRAGGTNQDGSPRRYTTMFNTRELPMAYYHTQEANSVGRGLFQLLYNKMVLSPLVDAFYNRDYFGNELYDNNAPWYKATAELVDSELLNTFNPITLTGAQKAGEQGGGLGAKAMAFAGFGPAPAYASRSAIQNRINFMYDQHVAPKSRSYQESGTGLVQKGLQAAGLEDRPRAEVIRDARARLVAAAKSGDTQARYQAIQDLAHQGLSPQTAVKMTQGTSDLFQFAHLPLADKATLVKEMTQAQYQQYVVRNHQVTGRDRLALLRMGQQQFNQR